MPDPRRYQARPGRRAVVAADLAELRGPASGSVILPLRLFWSPAGRVWDLDKPEIAQAMYENVLQEAVREEELTTWLNGELLTPLHVNALTVSRLAKAPAVRDCPASLGR